MFCMRVLQGCLGAGTSRGVRDVADGFEIDEQARLFNLSAINEQCLKLTGGPPTIGGVAAGGVVMSAICRAAWRARSRIQ